MSRSRRRSVPESEPTSKTIRLVFATSLVTLLLAYATLWCVNYAKSGNADWSSTTAKRINATGDMKQSAPLSARESAILLPGRISEFAEVSSAESPVNATYKPDEFSSAFSRLNHALKDRHDKSPEEIMGAINHGTKDPGACKVTWNQGEPSLLFGSVGKPKKQLTQTLNECAQAVEAMP